ncbi:alpha/beta hydrolase [Carnobacterium gallinarum]|uniref:alpha/beta hydrolase n=1 Tax=Carnobacterium gallinarum TaxID=2749 RepID=UPI000554CFDA|nr:alpha/beta hydrolase [Carnobacterium gallinarum]
MEHFFKSGTNASAPPLLLLHGTGGDEHSLIDLATALSPDSAILSLRGPHSEQGANRFFRRFAEGQFDLEDLEIQTDLLLATVKELSLKHGLVSDDLVVIGYSNGANIAAHAMLERENSFQTGILFHAMSLGKHEASFDLTNKNVWLSAGVNDPIVPKSESDALIKAFGNRGSVVETLWTTTGHQLTYDEVLAAKQWLQQKLAANGESHDSL